MSPQELITDPVTGYIVNADGTGIQSRHKTGFLKHFRKSGDKTRAADSQGFRYVLFEEQLKTDKQFKSDYEDTLLAMKHELEGLMFEQASGKSGQKDRLLWLQKNFPGEYNTNKGGKSERSKSRVENLLEELK